MLVATVVLLVVLFLAAGALLIAARRRRAPTQATTPTAPPGRPTGALPGTASDTVSGSAPNTVSGTGSGSRSVPPAVPGIGSPARVWLERGERARARMAELARRHPALIGAADDADTVLTELRAAAAQVAVLDDARAQLDGERLRAERRRLDDAMVAAAGGPTEADLRTARDAVDARLTLATRHHAAVDALLVRMRAAVAGMEQAHDELVALVVTPGGAAAALDSASVDLADRLAGLRAGIAEVRVISWPSMTGEEPGIGQGQGLPGDVPGSVERPPRT